MTDSDAPPVGYHAWLDFNAPLSDRRADRIAAALAAIGPRDVLDLGCGWGELLLRVVAAAPGATGTGVDEDPRGLARGRENARARGLDGRVGFVEGDARTAERAPADVVLCVGASHAFGGSAHALRALRAFVRPGGRLLFGDGFWERPPSVEQTAALGATPDGFTDLAGLVDTATAAGFRPLWIQTASRDEWEEFESGYALDWEDWLIRHGDRPEAAQVRDRADRHRAGWLRGYRDVLGFAYLTLGVPSAG